jgi:hypothetical protein
MAMSRKLRKLLAATVCVTAAVVVFCVLYVRMHPLVFNESFFEHSHCIVNTGLSFEMYASDHDGHFPADTNGYGNALLQITNEVAGFWAALTGPGYDGKVFADAARTGRRIPEAKCGRVYIQGLSKTNDPDIAIFFDKMATPGGDHCHFIHRILAPLSREVWTIGDGRHVILETEWGAYAKKQIELLVAADIPRARAEEYYAQCKKP